MQESIEALRRRAEAAEAMLRAHDVAAAKERHERLAREQKEADERASAEREAARATELEKARQGSWVNHKLKVLIESGRGDERLTGDALTNFVPATGWPPGEGPEHYGPLGTPYAIASNEEVAQTPMGKMLSTMLERQDRVRRAK